VTGLLRGELEILGVPSTAIEGAATELDAVRRALDWSREGDLLLLLCHESREAVIALLERLQAANWSPGDPVPSAGPPTASGRS
jgi:uroporphyrinogen-III synthase